MSSLPNPQLRATAADPCYLFSVTDIIIYTDGGARGNPGPAGAGVVIQRNGETVATVKKFLGEHQTNNWAEYEAVSLALQKARELGLAGDLEFRLDSKLVVEQLMGNWKIKEPSLKPQVAKIKEQLADFGSVRFGHVPREENAEADALVNEAIDEAGH